MVVTPMDVVKQRMQMSNSRFASFTQCTKDIYRTEGLSIFFRSYPTTALLNIPFQGTYFVAYESVKLLLNRLFPETKWTWLLAGSAAGAAGGFISTPLDVAKTYIQTTPSNVVAHPVSILRAVIREKGYRGLWRGAGARVCVCSPAAAVCWTTFESVKRTLGYELPDEFADSLG